MPTETFFRLPEDRRARLVQEAIVEFSDRTYTEASLSQIARRITARLQEPPAPPAPRLRWY